MTLGMLVTLLRDGIVQILLLASPVLGAALIVGLIVAVFQATTSIQEQTLTFVPKLVTILAVLALLGGWMFTSMRQYTIDIFGMIGRITR
ncbi:flagellar biosynthesis protein FliQ [Treponema lecithinolyticum]|jgi:flagellar biosynthetic protein fliQ|uniref:Flagellar biosynthetic protein FliQ n=1 Tax=Treponema lecithinolyticum ATCC 700332 TaxID=1321815 RepID=A0ABN0NY91_TRELE|nr:flagellar biosynthesis protein FliQ [Treponema lecithinolyticum]ERJ92619.1 flagellar biosynthetic protein FliQ [Treponema lecithinolyticum ATCC 700332]